MSEEKTKKMKILVATGIYPPDIGGPATYAKNLKEEWEKNGHQVKVLFFRLEKKLPTGVRHLYYFFRLLFNLSSVDFILILDTFSVGLPTILAAKLFNKKTILRTGGDFLWEQYVKNHRIDITLKDFYISRPKLNFKERTIYFLTKYILRNVNLLIFSTIWQRDIFIKNYNLKEGLCRIVENFYPLKSKENFSYQEKNFLWAGRMIRLKNVERLRRAMVEAQKQRPDFSLDLITGVSSEELAQKIKNSYAIILPSLSEISPNFILEAIKYNKPFIVTRENGLMNRIEELGIFIDPLDEEDIKSKILYLAEENNYKLAREKNKNFNFTHSWQEIAKEFICLFQKI